MSADQRRALRQELRWEGLIIDPAGAIICRCRVVNVATTGAKLALGEMTDVPDEFVLVLSKNAGVRRQCEVVWRSSKAIGVRFIAATPADRKAPSYMNDMLSRMLSKK